MPLFPPQQEDVALAPSVTRTACVHLSSICACDDRICSRMAGHHHNWYVTRWLRTAPPPFITHKIRTPSHDDRICPNTRKKSQLPIFDQVKWPLLMHDGCDGVTSRMFTLCLHALLLHESHLWIDLPGQLLEKISQPSIKTIVQITCTTRSFVSESVSAD